MSEAPLPEHHGKLFYTWLLSYVSILFIPLILVISSYIISIANIKHEVNRVNRGALTLAKNTIDDVFEEVRKVRYSLEVDSKIMPLLRSDQPLTPSQRFTLYQYKNRVTLYKAGYRFIDEYFLFFKNNDLILNPSGSMSSKDYYDLYHTFGFASYPEWLRFFNQEAQYGFYHLRPPGGGTEGSTDPRIVFLTSLPSIPPDGSGGALAITINERKLTRILEEMTWSPQSHLLILDDRNRIVLSAGGIIEEALFRNYFFGPDFEVQDITLFGKPMVISSTKSAVTGFRYVSLIPRSVYMEKTNRVRVLSMIGGILVVAVGFVMAYSYSSKYYNPIHRMAGILKKNRVSLSHKSKDEIQFITSSLQWIMEERNRNRETLQKHKALEKNNFLARLLNQEIRSEEEVREVLKEHGISLAGDYFAVMVVNPEQKNPRDIIVRRALAELFDKRFMTVPVSLDEYLAFLLNPKFQGSSLQMDSEIAGLCLKARNLIDRSLGLSMPLAVSGIHRGLASLPLCYGEAVKAMEYKMFMGRRGIIHYNEIKDNQLNIYKSYYTLEDEQKLANSFRIRDFYEAELIINNVFRNLSLQEGMSLELVKCAVFSIINTMLGSLRNISDEIDKDYIEKLSSTRRILSCATIEETRTTMIDILKSVGTYIARVEKHSPKLTYIEQFIEQNYYDYKLNVSLVSDVFNMNIAYLSRLFKSQRQENISEYINRTRVRKAKELLQDPHRDWSIKEVTLKCGFGNANTFIRVFKKFEGMTPGHFKELYRVTVG